MNTNETQAQRNLRLGNESPFDGKRDGDWADRAARGVLYELSDRCGIGRELGYLDRDIKVT